MKISILATTFSSIVQRILMELKVLNHTLEEHYDLDKNRLIEQVGRFRPDVIVCPFLTQRIPSEVWKNHIYLVVHPGIEGDRGPSSLDWAISEGEQSWGVTLFQADEEFDAGDIWGTRYFHIERLRPEFNEQLAGQGVYIKSGEVSIVDASVIAANRAARSREKMSRTRKTRKRVGASRAALMVSGRAPMIIKPMITLMKLDSSRRQTTVRVAYMIRIALPAY